MSAETTDVLIAGAGLAGSRCAEHLRANGFDGRIVIAGDEPHAPYERPALSKELLLGTRSAASLAQRPEAFWDEHSIELMRGSPVTGIDLGAREASIGGRRLRWRRLVVATGARARRIAGLAPLSGVHHLRTLADAQGLGEDLRPGARLVVIGAGFVGVEVASSARTLGLEVTIVEAATIPFARVLGPDAGSRLAVRIRRGGVDLRLGSGVARLIGHHGRVCAVELVDGARIDCDLVLVGVGAVPNTELVAGGPIALADDGGIATDPEGRSSDEGVFACGDVASAWQPALGRHGRLEHWTSADSGGRSVACAILGQEPPRRMPPYFWSDQFGWRLQMLGHARSDLPGEVEAGGDGFLVRYRDAAGTLHAGLAVNRPGAVGALRREMQGAVPAGSAFHA
jgi:3-phenylpropionate/trans-cinnamate dioxygenase ferredoxin reductase subunit